MSYSIVAEARAAAEYRPGLRVLLDHRGVVRGSANPPNEREERKKRARKTSSVSMDVWGLILMVAVMAIWLGLMGAVVHLVRVKARP